MKTTVAVAVLAAMVGFAGAGTTIYVDVNNTTGVEDGSAAHPYNTIQEGIDAAANGDEVIVAPGTYPENVTFVGSGITADFTLRSTDPTDPDVVAATVIDGGAAGRVVTLDGAETGSVELLGLTITNGWAVTGAGIKGSGTHAAITRCVVTGNSYASDAVDIHGVGMHNCDGPITHCIISDNSGSIDDDHKYVQGVGLYDCDGSITACTVSGNWGGGPRGTGRGGGLAYCDGAITDCSIVGNSIEITECGYDYTHGGGLYDCDGVISGCIVADNTAAFLGPCFTMHHGGGLAYCDCVVNCLVTGNSAAGAEGAELSGAEGGGLYGCDYVQNCTVVGNSAWGETFSCGGGLSSCHIVVNCVVWGNTADTGPQVYYVSTTPSYSCIQDWTGGGTGNTADDPLFVPGLCGDYYLSQIAAGQGDDSPCLDAGSDTAANLGLDEYTTRTDILADSGQVDMGYHYPYSQLHTSPLGQYWNLIGSQRPAPTPLTDYGLTDMRDLKTWKEAVAAGWVQSMLYYYGAGVGYMECRTDGTGDDDSVRPEYGYWLLTYQPGLSLIIPAP